MALTFGNQVDEPEKINFWRDVILDLEPVTVIVKIIARPSENCREK